MSGNPGENKSQDKRRKSQVERFFQVKEHGSTVKTEIMAGITTFMAMAYILMVNAGMFADPFGDGTNVLGVSYGAVYVATAARSPSRGRRRRSSSIPRTPGQRNSCPKSSTSFKQTITYKIDLRRILLCCTRRIPKFSS